jgi:hypothetical protein
MMRLSRDHLTFKALVTLDDAAECTGPAPKSFGLRFALAYLYATTAGERWLFDDFWKRATGPTGADYMPALARRQSLTACLNGICRAAGMERTPELMQRLRQARGSHGKRTI